MRNGAGGINGYAKRLKRVERYLTNHMKITKADEILHFLERVQAKGPSPRYFSDVQWITIIAAGLPVGKNFAETTQADIQTGGIQPNKTI